MSTCIDPRNAENFDNSRTPRRWPASRLFSDRGNSATAITTLFYSRVASFEDFPIVHFDRGHGNVRAPRPSAREVVFSRAIFFATADVARGKSKEFCSPGVRFDSGKSASTVARPTDDVGRYRDERRSERSFPSLFRSPPSVARSPTSHQLCVARGARIDSIMELLGRVSASNPWRYFGSDSATRCARSSALRRSNF